MEDFQLQTFALLTAIFVIVNGYLLQQRRLHPDCPVVQQQEKERTVTLLPFWASRPAALLACEESKFREKAMDKQARKFDRLLVALPEKVLDQGMDVVDNVPADFPYNTLKARLLETHTMLDQEKLDVLFKMEPLGGRKLSQLLASMLAYWPPTVEQMPMFQ
jgi:hypothetical protein